MSAVKEGGKLNAVASKVAEPFRGDVYTQSDTAAMRVPNNVQAGQMTVADLPRKFDAAARRDEVMEMKQQFVAQGDSPFGEISASDADFKWLKKKTDAEEAAKFDSWFANNFNVTNLAGRKWAQKVHPDFYQARIDAMIEKAKMALRINLINFRGPQNQQDMMLIWAINTGRVRLDEGWNVIGGMRPDATTNSKNLARGLLKVPRFIPPSQRKVNAVDDVKFKVPFASEANAAAEPFAMAPNAVMSNRFTQFATGLNTRTAAAPAPLGE